MQPIDGSYLYKLGKSVRPLGDITENTNWSDAWLPLFVAHSDLDSFINGSVYSVILKTSRSSTLNLIRLLKEMVDESKEEEKKSGQVDLYNAYRLKSALQDFEAVMAAEFGLMPTFLVTPRKGYDLNTLLYQGQALFPADLGAKVPGALPDVMAGARCMAFELWTAGAFHFHRVTESVLRRYWDSVLPNKPHPKVKTIGEYLRGLIASRKGSPKLKAALKDLKDLDRNPVLHPEYSLTNVEELDALMGSIRNAVVQMLKDIKPITP